MVATDAEAKTKASAVGSEVLKKLNRTEWNLMEVKHKDALSVRVSTMLDELGTGKVTRKFSTMGDDLYLELRSLLLHRLHLLAPIPPPQKNETKAKAKTKTKNNKAHHNHSKDQIRARNLAKNMKADVDEMLLDDSRGIYPDLSSKPTEHVLIQCMLILGASCRGGGEENGNEKNEKFRQPEEDGQDVFHAGNGGEERQRQYEGFCSIRRAYHLCKDLEGLSRQCVADVRTYLEWGAKRVKFDYMHLFGLYPRLVTTTNFDKRYPQFSIAPYAEQVEFMEVFKQAVGKVTTPVVRGGDQEEGLAVAAAAMGRGTLLCNRCSPGSGKTSLIVPMAKWCMEMESPVTILYTCSVRVVEQQLGSKCYQNDIPFAILHKNLLRKHILCTGTPIVILSDPESALNYLIDQAIAIEDGGTMGTTTTKISPKAGGATTTILVVDEPTVCADIHGHGVTSTMAMLMCSAPAVTVLLSATLPKVTLIDRFVSLYTTRHPASDVIEIVPRTITIGCNLVNPEGVLTHPFVGCTSKVALLDKLGRVRSTMFLQRLCTPLLLYHMVRRLSKMRDDRAVVACKVKKNLSSHMDTTNITNTVVVEYVVELLRRVATDCSDETVKRLFATPIKLYDSMFEWGKLLSEQAHRYLGCTLVVSQDPVRQYLEPCHQAVPSLPIDKIMEVYEKSKVIYRNNVHLNLKQASVRNTKKNKAGGGGGDDERDGRGGGGGGGEDARGGEVWKLESEMEMGAPTVKIPGVKVVNSRDHIEHYTTPGFEYDSALLTKEFDANSIPYERMSALGLDRGVVAGLYCSIGLYCKDSQALRPSSILNVGESKDIEYTYPQMVLKMCADYYLAMVFCGHDLTYGVDLPVHNVIISSDYATTHSCGTLIQIAGRAGRPGMSYSGTIQVDNDATATRLLDYEQPYDEARELNRTAFLTPTCCHPEKVSRKRIELKNDRIRLWFFEQLETSLRQSIESQWAQMWKGLYWN